jgi:hypothetical protein
MRSRTRSSGFPAHEKMAKTMPDKSIQLKIFLKTDKIILL